MNQKLKTIKYLQLNGLDSLINTFKLKHKRHNVYNNLILFKYDQINSPMNEIICQECRGLILDENNNWQAVSWPFLKFWNYGEGHAAKIDWSTARVFEKVDGSLIQLYFYNGTWEISTSGTPDASGQVNLGNITFKELFWKVWNELNYQLPIGGENLTFLFELCTPYNRVVVPHKTNRIIFHGARNINTGQEIDIYNSLWAEEHGWEKVKSYPLNNIEDIVSAANKLSPLEQEGYVICDAQFNRIKVKSIKYVALHHAVDGLSTRRLLEIVRTNEGSEFLQYFPELAQEYNKIKTAYDALIAKTIDTYNQFKHIESHKDFAFAVKDLPISGALFLMRRGKIGLPDEAFAAMPIKNLESILDLRSIRLTAGE